MELCGPMILFLAAAGEASQRRKTIFIFRFFFF
jgi:hypothetical protein